MLRDLQQQKKNGALPGVKPPRRSMLEKIPYLPLPVVLGGGGVVLLVLIWWMAGVLSDMMFDFEPANPKAEIQQVAAIEATATQEERNTPVAKDQLTLAEREAEPPAPAAVKEPLIAFVEAPAKVEAAPAKPLVKVASVKLPVVKKPPVVRSVKPKPVKASVHAAARTRAKVSSTQSVVKAPKRLHPDELPGAIRSQSVSKPEVKRIERPSRIPATTP